MFGIPKSFVGGRFDRQPLLRKTILSKETGPENGRNRERSMRSIEYFRTNPT